MRGHGRKASQEEPSLEINLAGSLDHRLLASRTVKKYLLRHLVCIILLQWTEQNKTIQDTIYFCKMSIISASTI